MKNAMTLNQARALAERPALAQRFELVAALDVLRRELDQNESYALEGARLRAHALRVGAS